MADPNPVASRGLGALSTCKITHLATGISTRAAVVTTAFEHVVSPKFASEEVYGRMDPIMTYQNTKRSFKYVFKTPSLGSTWTRDQRNLFVNSGRLIATHFKAVDGKNFKLEPQGVATYLGFVADLYKMMYPYYESAGANSGASFLRAAPLLRLGVGGLTTGNDKAGAAGMSTTLLFAPETFTVSSIAPDASKVAINIGSLADLRFGASADGYTVTLGGTILHEDNLVGWVTEDKKVVFGQGDNFPFRIDGDAVPSATGMAPAAPGKSPRELSDAEKEAAAAADNEILQSFRSLDTTTAGANALMEP